HSNSFPTRRSSDLSSSCLLAFRAAAPRNLCGTNHAEKVAQYVGDLLRLKAIQNAVPFPPLRYQVCVFQDRKMPRNRWPRDGKAGCDRAGRKLSPLEFLKNLAAGWISQGAKRIGNGFHY